MAKDYPELVGELHRKALVADVIPANRVMLDKLAETAGSAAPRDARRAEVAVQQ